MKFINMFIKENLNDVILRCWIVIPRKLGWTEWVNVTGGSWRQLPLTSHWPPQFCAWTRGDRSKRTEHTQNFSSPDQLTRLNPSHTGSQSGSPCDSAASVSCNFSAPSPTRCGLTPLNNCLVEAAGHLSLGKRGVQVDIFLPLPSEKKKDDGVPGN